MPIHQGDLYWLAAAAPGQTHAPYSHPYVVIQDDLLNNSRLSTVVVCALTSNLKRLNEPGNILLEPSEGNLPRQSVIIVSQLEAVEKAALGEYIGSLSKARVEQIFAGIRFQQTSFFTR